jgi:4-hydroxybenzoate polyprenyltransferase
VTVTDYLRIGRAQTAAVEGAGFPLAAWVGGAPLWSLPVFAFIGVLAHLGGFGQNGITDLEFDRLDPSKADHPLVTGRVKRSKAVMFVAACQVVALLTFISLLEVARPSSGWLLPLALMGGYILLGTVYNVWGKRNKPLAVLEISGAFALAFLAMATVWTGHISELVALVGAYAFAMVAFQIAIAGEEKELAQANEKNLLRRLGMRVEGDWLVSDPDAILFATGLTFAKVGALMAVGMAAGGLVWTWVTLLVSLPVLWVYQVILMHSGPFDRPKRLRIMGAGEALSYVVLVLALGPLLWPWLWVLFIVLPVGWFVGLNRVLWPSSGSVFAPGV